VETTIAASKKRKIQGGSAKKTSVVGRRDFLKIASVFRCVEILMRETTGSKSERTIRWESVNEKSRKRVRVGGDDHDSEDSNTFFDDVDGLHIEHDLSGFPIVVRIRLSPNHYGSPRFIVDRDLADTIGITEGTWSQILSRFWAHAKRAKLIDRERCLIFVENAALQRKLRAHVLKIERLEKQLRRLIRPAPKSELLFKASDGSRIAAQYDVPIIAPNTLMMAKRNFLESIRLAYGSERAQSSDEAAKADRAANHIGDFRRRLLELSATELRSLRVQMDWHERTRRMLSEFIEDPPGWLRKMLSSDALDSDALGIPLETPDGR